MKEWEMVVRRQAAWIKCRQETSPLPSCLGTVGSGYPASQVLFSMSSHPGNPRPAAPAIESHNAVSSCSKQQPESTMGKSCVFFLRWLAPVATDTDHITKTGLWNSPTCHGHWSMSQIQLQVMATRVTGASYTSHGVEDYSQRLLSQRC